jgi:hypothetical protein
LRFLRSGRIVLLMSARQLLQQSPALVAVVAALAQLDPRTVQRYAAGRVTARVERMIVAAVAQLALVRVPPKATGVLAEVGRVARASRPGRAA